jgi:hypothetical protein
MVSIQNGVLAPSTNPGLVTPVPLGRSVDIYIAVTPDGTPVNSTEINPIDGPQEDAVNKYGLWIRADSLETDFNLPVLQIMDALTYAWIGNEWHKKS